MRPSDRSDTGYSATTILLVVVVFAVAVGAGALARIIAIEAAQNRTMIVVLSIALFGLATYITIAVRRYKRAASRSPSTHLAEELLHLKESQRKPASPAASPSSAPTPDAIPSPPDAPRSSGPST